MKSSITKQCSRENEYIKMLPVIGRAHIPYHRSLEMSTESGGVTGRERRQLSGSLSHAVVVRKLLVLPDRCQRKQISRIR